MPTRLAAVILAGGLGTRMKSSLVKHLHPVLGRRMVDWVVEAARPLGADPLVVVASPATADAFTGLEVAVQEEPLGTGDAVRSAREAVWDADEVLVLHQEPHRPDQGGSKRARSRNAHLCRANLQWKRSL